MKRFVFKLGALLELRKQHEENIKLLLAEKNREIIAATGDLNRYYEELKELQSSEKTRRAGQEPVQLLRYSVAYRYKLKSDILRTGRWVQDLQAEASGIQKKLLDATKARRALEIIRDRQFDVWKKEYRRKEQNFIDDVAQQKYIASH
ncbi:MAG: flagellar export protein FliJ [Chitinispirillaceae bacterium]|nr:flagellar export protein FliJ [Chitinispirillaceae bacterium]